MNRTKLPRRMVVAPVTMKKKDYGYKKKSSSDRGS